MIILLSLDGEASVYLVFIISKQAFFLKKFIFKYLLTI